MLENPLYFLFSVCMSYHSCPRIHKSWAYAAEHTTIYFSEYIAHEANHTYSRHGRPCMHMEEENLTVYRS